MLVLGWDGLVKADGLQQGESSERPATQLHCSSDPSEQEEGCVSELHDPRLCWVTVHPWSL